jgi:hypothetical protein
MRVVDAKPTEADGWGESWQFYALLAGACLLVVFVPAMVSAVHSVDALDVWVVVSTYLGISWVAPAACLAAAVGHHAREQGRAHSTRRGIVTGIVTGSVLLVCMLVVIAPLVGTGQDEEGRVDHNAAVATERAAQTPVEIVRASVDSSHPAADDVLCAPRTRDTTFCVVTFKGRSCQLWLVRDREAKALMGPILGTSGTRSSSGVRCS